MDNKIWLEVNQAGKAKVKVEEEAIARLEAKAKVEAEAEAKAKAEAIEKSKVVVVAWLKTEECKNAIKIESKVRLEMEGSIKVKDGKKIELEGKITKENAKLVAEKKTEKAGIEAEVTAKAEGKGKAKPKYKYVEHFTVKDHPYKETAPRDGCASNQLAEAKIEREDTLKAEEYMFLLGGNTMPGTENF